MNNKFISKYLNVSVNSYKESIQQLIKIELLEFGNCLIEMEEFQICIPTDDGNSLIDEIIVNPDYSDPIEVITKPSHYSLRELYLEDLLFLFDFIIDQKLKIKSNVKINAKTF